MSNISKLVFTFDNCKYGDLEQFSELIRAALTGEQSLLSSRIYGLKPPPLPVVVMTAELQTILNRRIETLFPKPPRLTINAVLEGLKVAFPFYQNYYIGDVVTLPEAIFSKPPFNMGLKKVQNLCEALDKVGLRLGMKFPDWVSPGIPPQHNVRDLHRLLNQRTSVLNFSPERIKILQSEYPFLGHLVQTPEHELLRIVNFGTKNLQQLRAQLYQMGIYLGVDVQGWKSPTPRT